MTKLMTLFRFVVANWTAIMEIVAWMETHGADIDRVIAVLDDTPTA